MEYSPILAVATAAFEILAGAWALSLVRSSRIGSRSIPATTGAILLLLAGYQLTEVGICADPTAAGFLPRLAFLVVTWLPPLGLLLVAQIARPRSRLFRAAAGAMLALGAGMAVWIVLDPSFATASVCGAVYARYVHAMPRFQIYGAYYWLGLLGIAAFSAYGILSCDDPARRRRLADVHVGTLAFVLPSIAVSYVAPATRGALPSVMCHFALVFAVALVRMLWVMRAAASEAVELTRSAPEARI
jgi:hypothetical protein